MRKIDYVIQNLSPVNFAEKSTDSIFYATKKYVTGSALRGALATMYIQDEEIKKAEAHLDGDFYDLFLSGMVRYLPAYPIGKADEDNAEAFVLPPSVVQSKDGKQIYDMTVSADLGAGFKKCQGMVVNESGNFYKVEAATQITFHMARNGETERIKGSSDEGHIYNYEYIESRQKFKGSIIADDAVAEKLDRMLQRYTGKPLYLGRGKNAQYGQCILKVKSMEVVDYEIVNGGKIYLHALTPFIPYFPFQNIDEAASQMVAAVNGALGVDALSLEGSYFANKEEVNGYVGVWRSKRERVNAISAGSLVGVVVSPETDMEKLVNVLHIGLGDRTAEGYGQFRVWEPMENIRFSEFPERAEANKLNEAVVRHAKMILDGKILLEVKKAAVQAVAKTRIGRGANKHVIKRVEALMNSNLEKGLIQKELRNGFKDTAKENLRSFGLNNDDLFELLVEDGKVSQPYADIRWQDRLQLKDVADDLLSDLGRDVFAVDENVVYRTYWLWYARHLAKKLSELAKKSDVERGRK